MIIIKNGKLFKDGQLMPIEFGNLEQIKALEKHKQYESDLLKGIAVDYMIEVDSLNYFDYNGSFKCLCSDHVFIYEMSLEDESPKCMAGKNLSCECGLKYETYMEFDEIMVQLIR